MKSLLLLSLLNPPAELLSVPKAHLDFWNTDDTTLRSNNCYNYSTNRVTNSFAQPGEAAGAQYQDLSCAAVLEAASKDFGLVRTEFFPYTSKSDDTLIALVVAPSWDFHWYRRDADNMWTHKPGGTPATNLDGANNPIVDPAIADRGPYSDFCGYFRVKNYPVEDHEQNAGHVRIGNMVEETEPTEPQNSEVEVLMYSGRRNPRYPLKDMMRDSAFRATVLEAKEHLAHGDTFDAKALSTLGSQNYLIIDREGLVFPKGTQVQIPGGSHALHY